jgi:glycosyltransferase involved in cell wall biosynthesis
MRLGFVITGSLDLVSGGFLYDRMLIQALRARGVEVDLVELPWDGFGRALVENFRPWPVADDDAAVDVVVQDELCHPAVFARNRRWRGRGVPVVGLVHNLANPPGVRGPRLRAAIERRYLSELDAVIAVCDATLADVRAVAGPPRASVVARAGRVEPAPAIDVATVERRSQEGGPLRLLVSGTVMRHKGLLRLVEALAALPAGSFTLDVAGSVDAEPAYVAAVERAALRRGLAGRLRLHGELRGDPLWELYRRSQVLVLPSDREAYSLACLEAMAFGLPVLVTDRGGMAELVTPGEDGFLLSPDDAAAWAATVQRLAADRRELAALSRAALTRHARHGTWADTAAVVEGFLRGLAANGAASTVDDGPGLVAGQ